MTTLTPASIAQNTAADPARSTWLSANAGSGKTRVLTDRVARLLLHGTNPQSILCLTYTKAAATEMQPNPEYHGHAFLSCAHRPQIGTQLVQVFVYRLALGNVDRIQESRQRYPGKREHDEADRNTDSHPAGETDLDSVVFCKIAYQQRVGWRTNKCRCPT